MLSYRHAFHAGNHADVLKHIVLIQLSAYLGQKEKPYWVIDTHAGGGLYDLTSGYATKSGESASGIANLWPMRRDKSIPEAVRSLLKQVALLNDGDDLKWYPGSPQLAAQMLREGDHLVRRLLARLAHQPFRQFELHEGRHDALRLVRELLAQLLAQCAGSEPFDPGRRVDHARRGHQ